MAPLPKKLSIIVSSRSLLGASTNLFRKTLSLRSLLSTTANKECDLGHFTPGRSLSSQLVIRLSSSTVPHPISSPLFSSPLALVPLLPNHALPCLHKLVRLSFVMASAPGVNHPAPLLLRQASPFPCSCPLRGTTDAYIILDVHKMLTDNISFVVHSSDNCYYES